MATSGHFCWPPMGSSQRPLTLLGSQLAVFEALGADESGFAVDIAGSVDEIVTAIASNLSMRNSNET
jgi:gluconate kinase